jgi:hypothetical protein
VNVGHQWRAGSPSLCRGAADRTAASPATLTAASARASLGLKMDLDFLPRAGLIPSTCGRRKQSIEKSPQRLHVRSSALTLKKRAISAVVSCQRRVSAWSCCRPPAVNLV